MICSYRIASRKNRTPCCINDILQSSYTKTALETEIARDTASADAVHKLVNGRIGKEDFDQIKDQSDEKKQIYKDISSYFNEIRTLISPVPS